MTGQEPQDTLNRAQELSDDDLDQVQGAGKADLQKTVRESAGAKKPVQDGVKPLPDGIEKEEESFGTGSAHGESHV